MRLKPRQFISVIVVHLLIIGWVQASNADNYRTRLHEHDLQQFSVEDIQEEILFGKEVAARLLAHLGLWQHDRITRYVSLVGHSLLLYSPRRELNYYFAIVESSKINAYSTPGGYVFITLGALRACQDESELAAIIAHEIAHIIQRHIVKTLNISGTASDSLLSLSRMVSASSSTAKTVLSQMVNQAMDILFEQGYLIQQEFDADQLAMTLLAQAGYDPTALQRYLNRLNLPATQTRSFSRTHPLAQQRFEYLNSIIEEQYSGSTTFHNQSKRFSQHANLIP